MQCAIREFGMFGLAPIVIALVCLYGVIGGFKTPEAIVPLYALGLFFGVTAIGVYAFALLFRTIRWLMCRR